MPQVTVVIHPHLSVGPPARGDVEGHRARLAARRIGCATVISVSGDIDACNMGDVAAYIVDHLGTCKNLLLDLSRLEFFGVSGFSDLHRIGVVCAQRGISWLLVPSAAVSRMLRVCDPGGALPIQHTVPAGLVTLERGAPRNLRAL